MHYVPGCPIAKSKDLVNWEMAGYAVERYDEDPKYDMKGGTKYTAGSWANTIRYRDGKFYVGFCTPNGDEPGHFSMCTATNVKGPWKRTIFPEYMYDPGLLFDDDGKVYVAHGQGTIYISELNKDALSVKTPQKEVYHNPKHPYLEGSHFYKINGMYYMLSSSSGVQQVCLRSKNIYGPYEEKIVLKDKTPIPYTTYPPHQGGMVQLKDGSWWFVIMQDYGPIGRTPNLLPVTWVDGWPMLGVNGKMVATYTKPNVGVTCKATAPATTDEFNSPILGLQWQWNHNPDNAKYSLTERPGYMRLKASKAAELSLARNTLTQRVVGPNSTGTVVMDVRGMKDGNIAGFGIFQSPYAYVGIKQEGNIRKIVMNNNNVIIDSINNFIGKYVWFQAITTEKDFKASFYYSTDGKKFNKIGNDLTMDLGYPWTANRFTLFNFSTTDSGIDGQVDFNWFHFQSVKQISK
jgi:beta-xylosidase